MARVSMQAILRPGPKMSGTLVQSSALPHGDAQLQLGAEALPNLAANQLNEAEDVAGAGAGMGDNVAGVPLAHLRAADARLSQAGLVDEDGGALAPRILEHAHRRLEAQRLACLPVNPGLAQALDDGVWRVPLELEVG